ncbi:MAG: long-chain-fatty-acid--CoA ligase [Tistlia sp.]|uniref:long-chain-fatty-acid--CoA ligase n=1 Tax=Tistlia sp. TaxID=3057121 RepID=UPI0034A280F7
MAKFSKGLHKRDCNFVPLSPIQFLETTARSFPERTAVVYNGRRCSYADLYRRCCRLASALRKRGIGRGDVVALIAPNVPEALEAHYGIPMAGAVINPVNLRLDAEAIAFILDHGEARAVIADTELAPQVKAALALLGRDLLVVDIEDPAAVGGERIGEIEYEALLAEGDAEAEAAWIRPEDEWDPIALSYTSGTTGDPKGVVYHHRGAFISSFGQIAVWTLPKFPVYLWTLPMFHSYGWCFPYTITALAGTHVMLRKVVPETIFELIERERVTNMCAAPVVLTMLINAAAPGRGSFTQTVQVMTAGSSPPPTVLEKMTALGFDVIHAYGLTECTGCVAICQPQDDWPDLTTAEVAERMARQGVSYPQFAALRVADPESLEPVPWDGTTMGEVLVRGSSVMRGYLKNPEATEKAFASGWFHTGDLAVMQPDGYLQIRDRSKDVIISGGENISSVEVEYVIYRHPKVLEAAVVAKPHPLWEETPCAFVTLRDGEACSEKEIIDFCRQSMAHYKCPTSVVFGPLPKTATGKIQKFQLRQRAVEM